MLDPFGQAWQNGNALAAQTPGRAAVNKQRLCGSLLSPYILQFSWKLLSWLFSYLRKRALKERHSSIEERERVSLLLRKNATSPRVLKSTQKFWWKLYNTFKMFQELSNRKLAHFFVFLVNISKLRLQACIYLLCIDMRTACKVVLETLESSSFRTKSFE